MKSRLEAERSRLHAERFRLQAETTETPQVDELDATDVQVAPPWMTVLHFLEGVAVAVVGHGHPGGRNLDVGRVELVDLRGLRRLTLHLSLQPGPSSFQPGLYYLS